MFMRMSLVAAGLLCAAATPATAQPGAELFKRYCGVCHADPAAEAQAARMGPSLKGIVGRAAGTGDYNRYSLAMKTAGFKWDRARLDTFLKMPRQTVKGTTMAYPGLRNDKHRKAVVDYIMTTGK